MDKFVKGENKMWKIPVKVRIQTTKVAVSALNRVLDFCHRLLVCPAVHTEVVQAKKKTAIMSRSSIGKDAGDEIKVNKSNLFTEHRIHYQIDELTDKDSGKTQGL